MDRYVLRNRIRRFVVRLLLDLKRILTDRNTMAVLLGTFIVILLVWLAGRVLPSVGTLFAGSGWIGLAVVLLFWLAIYRSHRGIVRKGILWLIGVIVGGIIGAVAQYYIRP